MAYNTFRMENSKLYRRKLIWIEMAVMGLLVLLLYALMVPMTKMGTGPVQELVASMGWPNGVYESLSTAGGSSLGGYLAIILVAVAVGQEYTWRTMHLWLSRGLSRTTLLVVKFASFLAPLALLVLTALVTGAIGSALVTLQADGSVNLVDLNVGKAALRALYTTYTLLPYAAITLFVTVVTRSTTAGLGITIAFAFMVEGLLIQLLSLANDSVARIGQFLPSKLAQSLLFTSEQFVQIRMDSEPLVAQLLDPMPAAALIAGYVVVFLGLAVWSFRRQDLTA
ncbi:MAG: ABC transporter permease subunit [Anaerolineae bacterium]|jgi:ABC-type transport system involved in multi-copper enzyme maturation permease subunit